MSQNNKNGILVSKLDPIKITDSLINLYKNRIILEKIGYEARNTIINKFSDQRVFKLWDKILWKKISKLIKYYFRLLFYKILYYSLNSVRMKNNYV